LGYSVSGAGDFNGDGLDDIILGAPNAAGGRAYIVYGHEDGVLDSLNVDDLNGSNGVMLKGLGQYDSKFGYTVSNAGDFNDDGLQDVAIGAIWESRLGAQSIEGAAYVLYGDSTFVEDSLDLSNASNDRFLLIMGDKEDMDLGASISSVDDFNGDGIDDLVLGTYSYQHYGLNANAYVVFGGVYDDDISIDTLNEKGLVLQGEFGNSWEHIMVEGGDFNGDGIGDVMVRQPNSGMVNLVYGTDELNEPSAVAEVIANSDFGMYPNPTTNYLYLNAKGEGIEFNQVLITDITGKSVMANVDMSLQSNKSVKLNVSNLSPGSYFVTIETREGKQVSKFVKK